MTLKFKCWTVTVLASVWLTVISATSEVVNEAETDTLLRERRDGYGGGGSYGGGGGYGGGYGGSSYGCSCPYVYCDNQNNGLLAFGVGALLGLLLALLRNLLTMAAMAPAPAPAPAGRMHPSIPEETKIFVDYANNVSWAEGRKSSPSHKSTLLELLHLPNNLGDDLGPVMADVLRIYTDGAKKPECMRRWVCEAMRDAVKINGFSSRFASLSSLVVGWFTNDISPILQTIFPQGRQIQCELLSPNCDVPLRIGK